MAPLALLLLLSCGPKKGPGESTGDSGDGGAPDGGAPDGGATDGGGTGERQVGTQDVAALHAFVGEAEGELGSALAGGALGPEGALVVALGAPAVEGGAGAVDLYVAVTAGEDAGEDVDFAPLGSLVGRAAEDAAGAALAVGDLDGDGIADLAVGSRGSDLAGDRAGLVDLLSGPLDGDRALAEADATWLGGAAGDYAGGALAVADLDGGGAAALLVGCGQADAGGADSGAIYVLDLPMAGGSLSLEAARARIEGPAASALAGTALAAGDLDGDGLAEVVAGGFGLDGFAGGAWVAAGPVSGAISLAEDARASLAGPAGYDLAGRAVAVADLDGDGAAELIVSVPGDDGAASEAGAVLIFVDPRGALSAGTAAGVLRGAAYDRAGWALAPAGDVDGDGAGELLVGAPGADDSAGAAWLVYGPVVGTRDLDAALDLRWQGTGVGAGLGDAVAGPAGLGGEGRPGVLLGAPSVAAAWLWGGG